MTELEIDIQQSAALPLTAEDKFVALALQWLNEMFERANQNGMSIVLLTKEEMLETGTAILAGENSGSEQAKAKVRGDYIELLRSKGLPEALLPEHS